MQGVHSVISYYGNSVIKALLALFPNIGLNISKFTYVEGIPSPASPPLPSNYVFCCCFCIDIVQERRFFVEIAEKHRFDPLNAENWYSRSLSNILKSKVSLFPSLSLVLLSPLSLSLL
jgi:hypothetical protein